MNIITRILCFAWLGAIIYPLTANSQIISTTLLVGTPEGSFEVSSLGSATYSVAVEAPQGLPGMQPQVNIVYNSMAGNGLVGFGCSLSGFSVITRGPRTTWYDDNASGITRSKEDAFYLDGHRLIEQENVAGRDSIVYCLESSPYTRVVLYGRNGDSQTNMWFQVMAPDGTKSTYGTYGQQLYTNNNTQKVNAWYVTRVDNAIGNYMTFSYSYLYNYLYPDKIYYGPNSIEFTYEVRPDIQTFPLEGVTASLNRRLKTIKTKTGSNVFREYTINYTMGDSTGTGFSRIQEITVKNGVGETMNPISFDWEYLKQFNTSPQNLNVSLKQSTNLVTFSDGFELMAADINGDGVSDIIQHAHVGSIEENDGRRRYYNDYYIFYSHINNGQIQYGSNPNNVRLDPNINQRWVAYMNSPIIGDFNGDNYQDVVFPYGVIDSSADNYFYFLLGKESQGVDTFKIKTYESHNSSNYPLYAVADLNNDGMSDLFLLERAGQADYYHCHIFEGNEDIDDMQEYHSILYMASPPKKMIAGDFNDDGMADALVITDNGYKIFWNRGGGLSNNTFSGSDYKLGVNLKDNYMVRDGDFNGDGIPDLLTNETSSNDWYFYISKGDGTFTKQLACQLDIYNQTMSLDDNQFTCLVYDMDGDGKSDVYMSKAMYNYILFHQVRSYWMLSDGTGLTEMKVSTSQKAENANPGYYMLGSFKKDGQCELAHYGYDCYNGVNANVNSTLYMFPNNNYAPGEGKVKKITNGLGNTIQISYNSLTDESVYTRSDRGEYPLFIVKPALPVVSSTTISNGIAGNQVTNYSYEDLYVHQPGRGLLGFALTSVQNTSTGVTTDTEMVWEGNTLMPQKSWVTQYIGGSSATTENTYINHFYHNTKALYHSLASSKETDMDGHVTNTVYSCDSTRNNVPLEITQTGYDNAQVRTTYNSYVHLAGQYLPTSISTQRKHPDDAQYFTTTNTYSYNDQGLKISETDLVGTAAALVTSYSYDSYGNMTYQTTYGSGVETVTKQYTYDPTNRFITESLERGYIKNVYTYDTWGNVLTASDQTRSSYPQTTTNTYDGWGRLATSVSPIGITSSWQWHWAVGASINYYVQKEETGQPWVKTYYDNVGREWQTQSIGPKGVNIQETLSFNNQGLLISKINSEGGTSQMETFSYDSRGRMLTDNLSSGESKTFTYGANWIRTNKNGQNYTKYYDSWGNVKKSSDPVTNVTYTYFSNGKTKSATTGGNVVSMLYDAAGRRTSLSDPSAGTTTYTYDAYGRLVTQTDARGYTTTNTYNSLGQLTGSTTGTITDSYVYGNSSSNNGLLVSASRGVFSANYTYDSYGRVTNETRQYGPVVSKAMSYTYNQQGHLATQTYPNQVQISYEYDNYGYLNRMLSGTKRLYKLEEYTGNTYEATLDNDISAVTVYDLYGRVDETGYIMSDQSVKYYQQYAYNQNTGNISSRTLGINGSSESFTYDNLDRLTSWTKNGITLDYMYENDGSMYLKRDLGSMYYNDNNPYAVSDLENPAGALALPQNYVNTVYNELGKVKQISSNYYNTTIVYGPDNQRWRSTQSDNVLYFDNYEEVTVNNVKRCFIYLENGVLAVSDDTNGTQFYYMGTDVLGSIMGIVDGSGNEVFAASYDPWGKQTVTLNNLNFRRGFTGHEMLPHYDLINMNGRLYDPYLARFLSPDNYVQLPDFSQSFNRYSYCLNNPLRYTDPSGDLFGIDDAIIGFTLIYGALSGYAQASMSGGNGWSGAAKGFATAALSLVGTAGIGSAFGHTAGSLGKELLRAGAHGLNNGLISAINGKGFGSGFISGSMASLAGSGAQALNFNSLGVIASSTGSGAIGSYLAGGSLLNGAIIGIDIGSINHTWETLPDGTPHCTLDEIVVKGDITRSLNKLNSSFIVLNRFAQTINTTIGEFNLHSNKGNITGYMLERGGPETTKSGLNKRIPEGVYNMDWEYSPRFGKKMYLIHNKDIPKWRGIRLHPGNYFTDSHGCLLPGSSMLMNEGDYMIKGSRDMYNSIIDHLQKNKATLIIRNKF